jgi:Family of unknown function (DUF6308)
VTFRLPRVLQTEDDTLVHEALKIYYGPQFGDERFFTGSQFDTWDSTGTRESDADRFTADDLVAVTFLSVNVPPRAAYCVLVAQADHFNGLLKKIGPDRDLADEPRPSKASTPAWRLYDALRGLKLGLGPTKASKLLARKRPRLVPIYDDVIGRVTETTQRQWEPLWCKLNDHDQKLHRRLLGLQGTPGVPKHLSPLRILDVVAWLEGKGIYPAPE